MMRFPFAAFIIALLFAASNAQAATYQQVCTPDQMGSHGGSEFLGVAFMLVSLAIAGAYMYGKAMHSAQAEVWARDEATNLLISALLFAGLAVFFGGACSIAEQFTGNSPFVSSYQYLDRLIYNNALPAIKYLVGDSLEDQKAATRYLYVGFVPFTGHGIGSNANYRALSANKEFVIDLLLPMVASLTAQRQILQMLEIFSTSILLPFAFILRLVPPTREMGNMLIALFFGLYIVAPTMYAMGGAAFEQVAENPIMHQSGSGVVYDFSDWAYEGGSGREAWLFRIGSVMPQAVFLPNLVIVVVTTCTMALAKGLRAIQA